MINENEEQVAVMQKEIALNSGIVAPANAQKLWLAGWLIRVNMHEHKEVDKKALCEVLVLSCKVALHMSQFCRAVTEVAWPQHCVHEDWEVAHLLEEPELSLHKTVMIA